MSASGLREPERDLFLPATGSEPLDCAASDGVPIALWPSPCVFGVAEAATTALAFSLLSAMEFCCDASG